MPPGVTVARGVGLSPALSWESPQLVANSTTSNRQSKIMRRMPHPVVVYLSCCGEFISNNKVANSMPG